MTSHLPQKGGSNLPPVATPLIFTDLHTHTRFSKSSQNNKHSSTRLNFPSFVHFIVIYLIIFDETVFSKVF